MPLARRRTALALLAATAALLVAGCGSSSSSSSGTSGTTGTAASTSSHGATVRTSTPWGSWNGVPGVLTTRPGGGWPANNGPTLRKRMAAMGFSTDPTEGQALHIHSHVDLYANGRHLTIPADIGIDAQGRWLAWLHTHDTTGVIHIESPTVSDYTLGQFFGVWGVRLSPTCLGGYCADATHQLRVWVDGQPFHGDPTSIVLAPHQEVAIAYGTPAQMPRPVPSSYAFGQGL